MTLNRVESMMDHIQCSFGDDRLQSHRGSWAPNNVDGAQPLSMRTEEQSRGLDPEAASRIVESPLPAAGPAVVSSGQAPTTTTTTMRPFPCVVFLLWDATPCERQDLRRGVRSNRQPGLTYALSYLGSYLHSISISRAGARRPKVFRDGRAGKTVRVGAVQMQWNNHGMTHPILRQCRIIRTAFPGWGQPTHARCRIHQPHEHIRAQTGFLIHNSQEPQHYWCVYPYKYGGGGWHVQVKGVGSFRQDLMTNTQRGKQMMADDGRCYRNIQSSRRF